MNRSGTDSGVQKKRRRRRARVEWLSVVGGPEQLSRILHTDNYTADNTVGSSSAQGLEINSHLGKNSETVGNSIEVISLPVSDNLEVGDQPTNSAQFESRQNGIYVIDSISSMAEDEVPQCHGGPLDLVYDVSDFDGSEIGTRCDNDSGTVSVPGSNTNSSSGEPLNDLTQVSNSSLEHLKGYINKMATWETMQTVVTTTGTHRLSVTWYNFFVGTIKHLRPDVVLPLYRTVRYRLHPFLIMNCYPASYLTCLRSQSTGTERIGLNEIELEGRHQGRNKNSVRVVLPTEWAKLDILTLPYYEDLVKDRHVDDGPDIYHAPITTMRGDVLDMTRQIQVDDGTGVGRAWPSDTVSFEVRGFPVEFDGNETIESGWCVTTDEIDSSAQIVHCVLGPIWMVTNLEGSGQTIRDVIDSQRTGKILPTEEEAITHLLTGECLACIESTSARGLTRRGRRGLSISRGVTAYRKTVLLEPGDVCVIIRPSNVTNQNEVETGQLTDEVCLYVCRFKQDEDGTERERLVWVRRGHWKVRGIGGDNLTVPFRVLASCVVRNTPKLVSLSDVHKKHMAEIKSVRRSGTLLDGSRYVLYPIMLYHDDFHTSSLLFAHSSVGGVYLMPIGFSNELRYSSSTTRPVSLTPPGMMSKEILKHIVSDVVKGMTEGVKGMDPHGNPIQIFLDVIGFLADYPAVSSVLDVKSHSADAPCHLCSFNRKKRIAGADFAYTVDIHSHRMANARFASRAYEVRLAGIDPECAKRVGMKEGDMSVVDESPLHMIHLKLKEERHRATKAADGSYVVSPEFDPYINTAVAPDHALMGVSKNALELFFKLLADAQKRKSADSLICSYLFKNGLPTQGTVHNHNTGGLHSMSMSSVFSVLLVTNAIADMCLSDSALDQRCARLIKSLHRLVAMVYWWPREYVDGVEASRYMGVKGRSQHCAELKKIGSDYLNHVHDMKRHHREFGEVLDKPNLHRILELCIHTVPLFGHACNVAEMPLESYHRILKDGLRNNTHEDKHISAIEHAVSKDWMSRLLDLYHIAVESVRGSVEYQAAVRGMLRLMAGEDVLLLRPDGDEYKQLVNCLQTKLLSDWIEPVKRHLGTYQRVNRPGNGRQRTWQGMNLGNSPYVDLIVDAKKFLRDNSPTGHHAGASILEFNHAAYTFNKVKGLQRKVYRHSNVFADCVISLPIQKKDVCNRFIDSSGQTDVMESEIFAVAGIIGWEKDNDVWAVCRHMPPIDETRTLWRVWTELPSQWQLLKFSDRVRRAASFHRCVEGCNIDPDSKKVTHIGSEFGGGTYKVVRRHEGYPPRMA